MGYLKETLNDCVGITRNENMKAAEIGGGGTTPAEPVNRCDP
jgi:hypothetical protein